MLHNLYKISKNDAQNPIEMSGSIKGKQIGTNKAVTKLEINVKVVIEVRFPPNLSVTMAAAAAPGPITHVKRLSIKIRELPSIR